MKHLRLLPLSLALGLALNGAAHAQSLVDLFGAAKLYDATYRGAQAQYEANKAKADQVISAIFPTINLQTNTTRNHADAYSKAPQPNNFTFDRYYSTPNMVLSLNQPLYRPANLLQYEQSKLQLAQAVQTLVVAEQDLIVRVSQAYFDLLASQDSLSFVLAQKAAVAEQLAAAKRNFEVGTATITDTREAEARFDLVKAQEIAARNDLSVKQLALETVTGVSGAKPVPLGVKDALQRMVPGRVDEFLQQAQAAHPNIRTAELALNVAKMEIDRAKAGHLPTVDLTMAQTNQYNYGGTNGNLTTSQTYWFHQATMGIQMNLPLFSGFSVQNRIKETVALTDKAEQDLEGARRSVTQGTKSAFLNLTSGLGQVNALEAAEDSSQLALDANKLGYTVGVRINIDVLNSQSQLYQTKRDLAQARYNVLMGALKLRQANGTLKPEDLTSVNELLK
jgi:outer membrane protein